MSRRPSSLLNTLITSLLLPGIIAAVLGVVLVYSLVKEEYDELQEIALTSKAYLVLQVLNAQNDGLDPSMAGNRIDPLFFEPSLLPEDELTMFWFIDQSGNVILQSPRADDDVFLARSEEELVTASGFRIVVVNAPNTPFKVVAATPMGERNEAITDVVVGVIAGFFLLGAFVALAAYLAINRSAKVIAGLSAEIATKDANDLSPVDRRNAFAELEPAIDTIDKMMARLDATIVAEREFATNAAHELRTPAAISISHVQRLRATLDDPKAKQSALEIENGLKRLTRLIERLLQMSRAQSGLGINSEYSDIAPVITLLLSELRARMPFPDLLVVSPPRGVWFSEVDPDAVGIILNNLFDNALKHAQGSPQLTVDASKTGTIVVSNDCAALSASELESLKQRFSRGITKSEGFGLGLTIVQGLCKQSGSTFEITSPVPGKARGFSAAVTFPVGDPF